MPVFIVDSSGTILFANQAAVGLLKADADSLNGSYLSSHVHLDAAESLKATLRQAKDSVPRRGPTIRLASGAGETQQTWIAKLGSGETALCTFVPQRDEEATQQPAMVHVLRHLLDCSGEALLAAVAVDAVGDLEVVVANEAFRELETENGTVTGPVGRKLCSLPHYFGVDAETDESVLSHFDNALKNKRPTAFVEHRPGIDRYFRSRVSPLRSASGEITHIAYHSEPISDAAQDENLNRRLPIVSAFRAIPAPSILLDVSSGEILEVTESYSRVVKVPRGRLIGRSIADTRGWPPSSVRDEFMARLRSTGSVERFEAVLSCGDGSELFAFLSATVVPHSFGRRLAACSITDISERRRVEQDNLILERKVRQAQKLEALGTLARGIAHDFNNIMGSIVARSALILADSGNPQLVASHVEQVKTATNRAKSLVRRILTFSQQNGADRSSVDLGLLVSEAVELIRPTLTSTTSISLQVDPEVPPVFADPTQIHQAIVNLCTNAAQALSTAPGRISICIDAVAVDPTMAAQTKDLRCGNYARVTITDTGCGMDSATLARIFDPFFTTKPPGQGTGLGLAVVHGVIKENDGALTVDSTPGAGTCFQLFFREHTAHSIHPAPGVRLEPGKGEHILLIEDQTRLSSAMSGLLERIGYRVTTCRDINDALEHLRAAPESYDLVLTDDDVSVPGANLSREVKQLRPSLPILVTNSHVDATKHQDLTELALIEPSYRPQSFRELSQSLRQALDNEPNLRASGETS